MKDKMTISSEKLSNLPSFSIIYETENLSSVELKNIYKGLDSIAKQDISPQMANEFLIIDSGDVPQEVIKEILSIYPWVTVKKVPEMEYFEAKMTGAKLATGEIIVFCDSDCEYISNWLSSILEVFQEKKGVNVVAGETSTQIRNPYEFAIAAHYLFPRFSKLKKPYCANHYYLNAVAFRRNFLFQNPIPTNLPLFRGNGTLHIYYICKLKGYEIWKHPGAQAIHEAPTPSFVIWRTLLRGRDRVIKEFIRHQITINSDLSNLSESVKNLRFSNKQKFFGIAKTFLHIRPFPKRRLSSILEEDINRLLLLPMALPVLLWLEFLYVIGSAITYLQPYLLLRLYLNNRQTEQNSLLEIKS